MGCEIYLLFYPVRIDISFYLPQSLCSVLMVSNAYCYRHQVFHIPYLEQGWQNKLSEGIRGQIIALSNEGYSQRKIAEKIKVSKGAVRK